MAGQADVGGQPADHAGPGQGSVAFGPGVGGPGEAGDIVRFFQGMVDGAEDLLGPRGQRFDPGPAQRAGERFQDPPLGGLRLSRRRALE
jgi:hypothetical protein